MLEKTLVVCDDTGWIWHFINSTLTGDGIDHLKISSSFSFKNNWARFKNSKRIIFVWENKFRPYGSIIEEIRSLDPLADVEEKIIVLTSAPLRQDVIYFYELGLFHIIRLENNKPSLLRARKEFSDIMHNVSDKRKDQKKAWTKVGRALDMVMQKPSRDLVNRLGHICATFAEQGVNENAVYFDIKASLAFVKGEYTAAIALWEEARNRNPNYYRAINGLIGAYHKTGENQKALVLIKQMHAINNRNLGRITRMGETYLELNNPYQAEGCFLRAIENDKYSDRARNGMAEVKFIQGELGEAKELLAQAKDRTLIAQRLNHKGIELVRAGRYAQALKHYMQAHFILPDQDKSSYIFYNIGLCHSRWGNRIMAERFLRLALVKNPHYEKAQRLLQRIMQQSG